MIKANLSHEIVFIIPHHEVVSDFYKLHEMFPPFLSHNLRHIFTSKQGIVWKEEKGYGWPNFLSDCLKAILKLKFWMTVV